MVPSLRDGDFIVSTDANSAYDIGDIVVVRIPGHSKPVVHRVVWCSALEVITRGDANSQADTRVPRSAIIGRVVATHSTQ